MIRKSMVALLIMSALAATYAGGSREDATGGDSLPVRLVIWGAVPAENGPQEVVETYNELQDEVEVEYVRYVNNDEGNARLDTALLAGEQIDAFISYSPQDAARRIEGGFAADMSSYLAQVGFDPIEYFGGVAEPYIEADGSVYRLPTIKWMSLVFANRDALVELGVDLPIVPGELTWERYREIAAGLAASGTVEAGHFVTPSPFMLEEYFRTATGRRNMWVDETGKESTWLSSDYNREGLQFFFNMMHEDESMVSWERVISDGLANQEAAVLYNKISGLVLTGTHQMRNVNNPGDYPRDFQVTFLPHPTPDESVPYNTSLIPNDLFSVAANSEYKQEVVDFLNWYVTEGFDPMISGGRLPLYQDYPEERVINLLDTGATLEDGRPLFDAEAFAAVVLSPAPQVVYEGTYPAVSEISSLMREEFESYYLQLQNLDDTLQNLDARTREILNRVNEE